MTDIRVCDGPDCEKKAMLNEDYVVYGNLGYAGIGQFRILERPGSYSLHFCSDRCLTNWTNKETRVNVSK